MPRDSLGDFEQLVLLAILRLRDDAYGIRIRDEIEERGGRTASLGAIYTALDRLERKKFVSSWIGGATAERGGRAKRYFQIEAAGQIALKDSLAASRRMSAGLAQLRRGAQ